MSCQFLSSEIRILPLGEGQARETPVPVCRLGRRLDQTRWAEKCRRLTPDAPCWMEANLPSGASAWQSPDRWNPGEPKNLGRNPE